MVVTYWCEFTSSDTVSVMVQVALIAHHTPNKRHAMARNGLIRKCSMLFRELTRRPNSNQAWLLCRTSVAYGYRWCSPVTAEARVRYRTSLCEVCGGRSGSGTCPPTPLALLPRHQHFTSSPYFHLNSTALSLSFGYPWAFERQVFKHSFVLQVIKHVFNSVIT
jgi:hypothetical protein